ncbi:Amino acid transporter isoform 2 [Hibiscus syriacus]|uniref:Amino acid transporter isoform 2 n=1 Tax=Hibiscus syriacus TaxID=106335 RepID=A0A6A2ZQZ8_HIBSY|nr:Amino acid transporter isoform 2 [Hibiscus syriacus]
MASEHNNGGSPLDLNVPFLLDQNQSKLQDLEAPANHGDDVNFRAASSFSKTCFNGLNALSGVGILSTPYAVASGGWMSLILLFAIATATFYSALLIQRCMVSDSNIKTYPDIGYQAFGKKGRLIVSVLMHVELYLVATGFLILQGDNLQTLLPSVEHFEFAGLTIGGKQGFIIIVALIILPTVWLNNLSLLSYISATGVLASLTIIGSVLWTGAVDGIGFQQKGKLVNWDGIPTAVSLFAFCYCAHPVFPTLYTSMQKRHHFSNVSTHFLYSIVLRYMLLGPRVIRVPFLQVMVVCFIFCTVCYASMAILGYLMFGSDVQSQITLNLPTNKLSSRIAIYTTLVNPISKYALMVTPIINATKARFSYHCNKRFLHHLIGTTVVISTMLVALVVPFFGSLMSLVGAFLSITASVILPCACYLKITGSYQKFNGEMVALSLIIVMGVIVVIFGTYTSLVDIIGNL